MAIVNVPGLIFRAHENHWFPLIRPAIKPLFLRGGVVGGGGLTSHNSSTHITHSCYSPSICNICANQIGMRL